MKKKIVLLSIVLISMFLSGCVHLGSGKISSEDFLFDGFTGVEVGSGIRVTISNSVTYSVSVFADDNVIDQIIVKKEGSVLRVYIDPLYVLRDTNISIDITMPDLKSVSLSGGSIGTFDKFEMNHDFTVNLSGESSLQGIGSMDNCIADLSGGSTLILEGNCLNLSLRGSGESVFTLSDFIVIDCFIELSGGSGAQVDVTGAITGSLSGESSLRYTGTNNVSVPASGGSLTASY